jgi:uncharacterized membrane protein
MLPRGFLPGSTQDLGVSLCQASPTAGILWNPGLVLHVRCGWVHVLGVYFVASCVSLLWLVLYPGTRQAASVPIVTTIHRKDPWYVSVVWVHFGVEGMYVLTAGQAQHAHRLHVSQAHTHDVTVSGMIYAYLLTFSLFTITANMLVLKNTEKRGRA